MRKIVFAALCAFAAVAVSCKNDRESDVNPGDSDIDGLYINEVYSCNPDWVELYNAGNKELHIGGFILQDDKGAEEEYVIPEGTTIGAGFIPASIDRSSGHAHALCYLFVCHP